MIAKVVFTYSENYHGIAKARLFETTSFEIIMLSRLGKLSTTIWRESSAGRLVSIILVLILSGFCYSKLVIPTFVVVFQYVEVKITGWLCFVFTINPVWIECWNNITNIFTVT